MVERIRAEARPDASRIAEFGLDLDGFVAGPVGVVAVMEKRRSGETRLSLTGDLQESRMSVSPFAWAKPPGQPAGARAELRIANESLRSVESFQVEAPQLFARGQVAFGEASRLERIDLSEARIFQGRFTAEARPPAQRNGPWRFRGSGPVIDLGPALDAPDAPPGAAASDSLPVLLEGHFDRVLLGPGRALAAVQGRASADARGVWREARVTGQAGPGGAFDLTISPAGAGRELRLNAANAGALLRAFDVLQTVEGGRLSVAGRWAGNQPGAILSGTAEMEEFTIQEAAGIGKLLQALTVYGVFDAVQGPGLRFSRLEAPFSLSNEALVLREARAFSASLGVTAKGSIGRRNGMLDLEGTIVPAYVLNSLLGQIPLLGRLFSPERGGGLFAATWRMRGPTQDPTVSVNPLAALTPGFLRGLFGGSAGQERRSRRRPPGADQKAMQALWCRRSTLSCRKRAR
ncbi:AsmA-like C-terminal region-containing protein [Pseudoroseomonas cervicalis]|uniref:AsmA-like C-terminal region-containing protein n=1 Tax=Teichococcus cervicalis TaxID=204525 RepID=UPI0035F05B7D